MKLENLRHRLTLVNYVALVSTAMLIIAIAIIVARSFNQISEEKNNDVWTILYHAIETISYELEERIHSEQESLALYKDRSAIYQFTKEKKELLPIDSSAWPKITSESIEYDPNRSFRKKFNFYKINAKTYGIFADYLEKTRSFSVYNTNLAAFLDINFNLEKYSLVYLLNREGQLLYQNSNTLNESEVFKRPLVRISTKSPSNKGLFKLGQSSLENQNYQYGFFRIIKDTNLILYFETKDDYLSDQIIELAKEFAIVGLAVIILFFILTRIFFSSISNAFYELILATEKISQGLFNLTPKTLGFGELNYLGQAFSKMGVSLMQRDEQIRKMMITEVEKAKIESQLAIGNTIQHQLLPEESLKSEENIQVHSHYVAAEEMSGDWFNYHYDEETNDIYILLADVSDHGPASALFTALLAGYFDMFFIQRKSVEKNLIEDFLTTVNRGILKYGQTRMHATMVLVHIKEKVGEAILYSLGHVPTVLLKSDPKKGAVTKTIPLSSNPLGMHKEVVFACRNIKYKSGESLFLFTDGILDVKSPNQKKLGSRRFYKIIKESSEQRNPKDYIIGKIMNYKQDEPLVDDICLVIIDFP